MIVRIKLALSEYMWHVLSAPCRATDVEFGVINAVVHRDSINAPSPRSERTLENPRSSSAVVITSEHFTV